MGRKKLTEEDISPELVERIGRLASLVWEGNQSEMGRALHIPQSVLSRVLAAKQPPSGKLLEGLATWPGVNACWLFGGIGDPLVEPGVDVKGGLYRPISDKLLPGPPEEYRDLLSAVGYPVAQAFFSLTSYWLRLWADWPICEKRDDIRGGDLVLMETAERWTRRRKKVVGKIVCFRIKDGTRSKLVLGEVGTGDQGSQVYFGEELDFTIYTVKLHGETVSAWWTVPKQEEAEEGQAPARGRAAPSGRRPGAAAWVEGLHLEPEQVVAVGIKLERLFGG